MRCSREGSALRYGPRKPGEQTAGVSPIYYKFDYRQDDWEVHRDNVSRPHLKGSMSGT